jgi:nucleoside-diphosphate-sugar epimerase|tara:strand:+ start:469 stop:1377 length:909 start_codon:yes stop_codon:yes gene_type:complete
MKKAIVTGGAGFIGSNLVDKLINMGVEVHVLDDLSTGKEENINPKAKFHKEDISKMEPMRNYWFLKDADVVFHCAALARVQPSIENPIPFDNVNVSGTLRLLMLAHRLGVKRFVYSASSSAYGNVKKTPTSETHPTNPLSPYGLQKYVGEQYCKMFSQVYGLDTVSLRYFNVYGEKMNLEGAYKLVIPIFAQQMLEGKPLTINNDGEQRRDFTYIGDVVEANILTATHPEKMNGEVFNIGNGDNYSVNELADMFGGEKQYGNKVIEPFETLADNSKARLDLNWEPTGDLPTWIQKYKQKLKI